MKTHLKSPHIILVILTAVACAILLLGRSHNDAPANTTANAGAEQLYVWIQADTLKAWIDNAYPDRGVETKLRTDGLTIQYNKDAMVLLHSNTEMRNAILDSLKAVKSPYRIKIDEQKRKITLTLARRGERIYCPAAIIADVAK